MDQCQNAEKESSQQAIPWSAPDQWRSVNAGIRYLIDRYPEQLGPCRQLAQSIGNQMEKLDALLCRVGAATCPWCPVPCCLTATVWLDFRDLLGLHLGGRALPLSQPKSAPGEICHYWTSRGCRLPRCWRPWTCTRYICPTQRRWWQKQDPVQLDDFNRRCQVVKRDRRALEAAFVDLVAGGGKIEAGIWPDGKKGRPGLTNGGGYLFY